MNAVDGGIEIFFPMVETVLTRAEEQVAKISSLLAPE